MSCVNVVPRPVHRLRKKRQAGRQAHVRLERPRAFQGECVIIGSFSFFAAYHSRVSQPRISVKVAPPVCLCMYIYTSLPCENAMSMMRAIDVIDCPFFPFLEVVSYHEILYVTCVFFFYTIDNVTRRLRI